MTRPPSDSILPMKHPPNSTLLFFDNVSARLQRVTKIFNNVNTCTIIKNVVEWRLYKGFVIICQQYSTNLNLNLLKATISIDETSGNGKLVSSLLCRSKSIRIYI